jgi:glycerophosphoryl diester phosphodiesterase
VFQLLYIIITSFIFVPAITYIFNKILWSIGTKSLLNKDVFKIGLHYEGIVGIILICILVVAIMFVEFGVIIVISQKKYFYRDISISDAFITSIVSTPKLFSFGILQLVLLFVLLVPFVDSAFLTTVIDNVNLILSSNLFEETNYSLLIYLFIFFIVIYIIIRWIFTIHFIIIEGQSARKAIKSSLSLTKNNKLRIIIYLIIFNLVILSIYIGIIALIFFVLSLLNISNNINNYLITFISYISIIFSSLLTPINIIFITNLFYKFQKNKGFVVVDNLKVYSSRKLKRFEKKLVAFFARRKYLVLFILLVYLIGTYLINYSVTESVLRWDVKISSHRGESDAPENSLSSVRSALSKGVDAIEIDVQLTKDKIVVLNHDRDLKRVANIPYNISDLTYDMILNVDISGKFTQFKGEKIPTLEEIMEEIKYGVKNKDVKLIIEIKPYGDEKELTNKVVNLIEKYRMERDCYIQSFSYEALQEVRNINKNIKIGQILYIAAGDLSTLDVDFYTIKINMLNKNFVKKAHKENREVWVWTVNSEKDIKDVLDFKIDGIITDYPERARKILLRR